MKKYAGKKAVVIGGTHGMGMAIVKALTAAGADVLLTGRNKRNVDNARAELGAEVHAMRSDVTDFADIAALAAEVGQRFDRFDALFVNQGYSKLEPFDEVTEESYDRHFAVNTKGTFFTVQRLVPLIRGGGSIVFTTSVADEGGSPGLIAYSASKAAMWSFAQGFAAELLPRKIRVNAVSPGFTATPSMGVDASDEQRAEFSKIGDEVTPMKRHGTVEEVAAAALFLAFGATFTTAVKLPVDGGLGRRISI